MGISRSYVLGWLGLSLGVSLIAASINVPTLWRVTHDGATTTGAVLAADLSNHQQIRYSYRSDTPPIRALTTWMSIPQPLSQTSTQAVP
jgi:hypothetical protein